MESRGVCVWGGGRKGMRYGQTGEKDKQDDGEMEAEGGDGVGEGQCRAQRLFPLRRPA